MSTPARHRHTARSSSAAASVKSPSSRTIRSSRAMACGVRQQPANRAPGGLGLHLVAGLVQRSGLLQRHTDRGRRRRADMVQVASAALKSVRRAQCAASRRAGP